MAFYKFTQMNPGGFWHEDHGRGIGQTVIVEAESAGAANRRAVDVGIYFDGVAAGVDCGCCGNRWWRVYEADRVSLVSATGPDTVPAVGYVHFADGSIERRFHDYL